MRAVLLVAAFVVAFAATALVLRTVSASPNAEAQGAPVASNTVVRTWESGECTGPAELLALVEQALVAWGQAGCRGIHIAYRVQRATANHPVHGPGPCLVFVPAADLWLVGHEVGHCLSGEHAEEGEESMWGIS